MPGPIFAVTIARGHKEKNAGALIALGHGIVEFPLMLLIYLGFAQFFTSDVVKMAIGLVGGAMLTLMGVQMFKARKSIATNGRDLEAKLADSIPKREAEIKTRTLEVRISELQAKIIELEARLAESVPKAQFEAMQVEAQQPKAAATVLKVKPETRTDEFEIEIPSKVVAPASFTPETLVAPRRVEPSKVLSGRPAIAEGGEYKVIIQGMSKRVMASLRLEIS